LPPMSQIQSRFLLSFPTEPSSDGNVAGFSLRLFYAIMADGYHPILQVTCRSSILGPLMKPITPPDLLEQIRYYLFWKSDLQTLPNKETRNNRLKPVALCRRRSYPDKNFCSHL